MLSLFQNVGAVQLNLFALKDTELVGYQVKQGELDFIYSIR